MEVEPQPSYSWWWNSHNKPKQSAWLQTTLADLDNKTKTMLSLVQEEADSFAKRADLYYTKRPELINLIEQFYRAHRSLAERYDHLKRETKQNARKAFQLQDAFSSDGFLELTFVKDQIFANESVNEGSQEEITMHDGSESDSEMSEVDNPEQEAYKIKNEGNSDQDNECVSALTSSDSEVDNPEPEVYKIKKEGNSDQDNEYVSAFTSSDSEVDNPEPEVYKIKKEGNSDQDNKSVSALTGSDSELDNPVHETAETENIKSRLREMEARISYLEGENSRLLRRLTMKSLKSKYLKEKIRKLKKEKSYFKEELSFSDREKYLLQKESDIVKVEYTKLRNEKEAGLQQRQVLTRKVGNLQKTNQRLSKQNEVMSIVLGFVNRQAASMARSNVMLRNEIQKGNQETEALIQSLKDEKRNAENIFEAEGKLVSEKNTKIEELQSEVRILAEQTREQDIQLLERNEEKREVIRQLSFALEALRDKNQRLEEALRNSRAGALCKVNTNHSASSQFWTWKKFLVVMRGGPLPQPRNHIQGRCSFGSLSLNLSEKHTAKILSLRE